ncbi:ABC transporter ATP-binding protein [Roseovarius pelagicus]|uniref:ABC transporter ATP-binding protein n=1 Tax=Roseovarius pelagicus TaxID=2980108 RepID=A0ABY6DCR7_9RHOB|nr:ABC transporter ATP-binding protein [Roseovarius pelagicus]UXX83888.1 ABC transporter ATP-binding protein [Roseovarius pelagicus]
MLRVDRLVKRYNKVAAVDNISFEVVAGETVALLGPSGCGKTTTLRMIAGFANPDAGIVSIADQDVTPLRPYERNIGILFQDYALFPHMTVRDNVAFGPQHRGVPKAEIPERVDKYLDLVGMAAMADRYPTTLSGGQQQRVALARAMATEPGIILLDEPLSALDAKLRERLRIELKQILKTVNAAAIVVTHDQDEALSLADRVLIMSEGRILQNASPSEVYHKPINRFVAEFVGRSNWLGGHVETSGGVSTLMGKGGISFVLPPHIPKEPDLNFFLRPESILISKAPPEHNNDNRVYCEGTVLSKMFLGQDTEVIAKIGDDLELTLLTRKSLDGDFSVGERVFLSFDKANLGYVND